MGSLDPQGPAAETMADLWWLMFWVGLAVFVLFCVLLALGLARSHGDDSEAQQRQRIRRWIVGGGVLMPLAILLVVFAATLVAMRALPTAQSDDTLEIQVIGHQWRFEVHYPQAGINTEELHIPVGRKVVLKLTSADVIHSFWVPELGGKRDLLPGDVNTLVLQADEPGRFYSRCAEFCGLHHADMLLRVVAEPPEQFNAWVAGQS